VTVRAVVTTADVLAMLSVPTPRVDRASIQRFVTQCPAGSTTSGTSPLLARLAPRPPLIEFERRAIRAGGDTLSPGGPPTLLLETGIAIRVGPHRRSMRRECAKSISLVGRAQEIVGVWSGEKGSGLAGLYDGPRLKLACTGRQSSPKEVLGGFHARDRSAGGG
jgi:hypothetical protein